MLSKAPVASPPRGDGVEEDGDAGVGNLPGRHALGQELALELQGEVAPGINWKKTGKGIQLLTRTNQI